MELSKFLGTFGDSKSEQKTLQIPFHILLSFPIFWKASKIIGFTRDAWNIIRDEKETDDVSSQTSRFLKHLKEESPKAISPTQPTDWRKTLGEEDYKILKYRPPVTAKKQTEEKRRKNSGNKHDTEHVNQLLRLLRNNYEHKKDRTPEEQGTLGWIKDDGKFSDNLFIDYFNRKFPKLILFLWWKFYEFEDLLQQYYSDSSLDHYDFNDFHWENESIIPDLVIQLHDSLAHHLQQGGLVERFLISKTSTGSVQENLLEFRTLETKTLSKLISDSDCCRICVNHDGLYLKWIDGNAIKEEFYYMLNTNIISKDVVNATLEIFVVSSNDVGLKNIISLTNRSIFLIDRKESDKSIKKIRSKFVKANQLKVCKNSPVCWNEVRIIQGEIRDNAQISIQKYKESDTRVMKLKEILPSDFEKQDSLLSHLNGKFLNILLKGKVLSLFHNYEMPKFQKSKYLERFVSSKKQLSSKVLRHRFFDVFLVSGISLDELGNHLNPEDKDKLMHCSVSGDVKSCNIRSNNRIFVLSDNDTHCENLIEVFKERFDIRNRNIHVIKCIGKDLFEWVLTHRNGTIEDFEAFLQIVVMSEDEFLNELVENAEDKISPVFIMDKPGMGKSCLLTSLSHKLLENYDNSFVIFIHMNEFVQKVKKAKKENIVNVIVNILCNIKEADNDSAYDSDSEADSENDNCVFEKFLLEYWVSEATSKFKLELMLDSLDEVDQDHKKLAIEILNVIKTELPSVRFWVTSREYMQHEIEKMFHIFTYKIEPFSEEDQKLFLKNCWLREMKKLSPRPDLENLLDNIIAQCVKQASVNILAAEFAGAPLQCGIIAEIYKENVIYALKSRSGKLENLETTFTNLISRMIKKKLEIYLEVKCKIPKGDKEIMLNALENNMHWHMYYAIKLFFPRSKLLESFATHLGMLEKKMKIIKETVAKEGIVENLDPPRFVHRTFGEYFLALFIHNVLRGEIAQLEEKELHIFVDSITRDALEFSKGNNKHDSVSNGAVTISSFKLFPLTYFLNELCGSESCHENTKVLQSFVAKIYDFDSFDRFETGNSVMLALMVNNQFHFSRMLLEASNETKDAFFRKSLKFHDLFIDVLIRNASVDFLQYFCSLLEIWYEEERQQTFTISLDHFKLALKKGKLEIVKFLVEKKGFDCDKWHILANSDNSKYGVIHYVIQQSRKDTDTVLEKRKDILRYLVKRDHSVLEHKDKNDRTPILLTPINTVLSLKMCMVNDLGANVNAICKFKDSVLHWDNCSNYAKAISPTQYHEMLKFFALNTNFKLINSLNSQGWTPLMCAIKTYYDTLSMNTLELFKKAGADFNIKCKGSTILDMCEKRKCKPEFLQKLIDCGAKPKTRKAKMPASEC